MLLFTETFLKSQLINIKSKNSWRELLLMIMKNYIYIYQTKMREYLSTICCDIFKIFLNPWNIHIYKIYFVFQVLFL